MKIDRIYLDLDCVLADLLPSLAQLLGRPFSPLTWPRGECDVAKVFEMDHKDLWAHVGAHGGSHFWEELPKTKHYDDLVELATLFANRRPAVVTCPQPYPSSYAGKALWLQAHDWTIPDDAFLCSEKSELSQPGRVLIDDNETNCREWSARGGHAIQFPTIANSLHQIVDNGDPIGVVRGELEQIEERSFGNTKGDASHA